MPLARPASVRPMEDEGAVLATQLTDAQRRVVEHGPGAMLVVGPAGSGRSEALAARLARLVSAGTAPARIMVLTRSRSAATHLRARATALIELPYEELWISTYEVVAERLLREHALEAGLDPFFATVRAADRLAMLLDRLDDLSLRRHEIRGNPAGLLARLLRRIDALKAERITPGRLRDWAEQRESQAQGPADRERARREREFAELYASHDRVLRDCGSLDAGDLVIELERLLGERADVRSALSERFPFLMVDELEDAGAAHRALAEALVAEHGNLVCACDMGQSIRRPPQAVRDPTPSFMDRHPDADQVVLDRPLRFAPEIATAAAAVSAMAKGEPVRASDEVAVTRLNLPPRRRPNPPETEPKARLPAELFRRRGFRRSYSVLALQRGARPGAGGGAGDRAPAGGRRGAARGHLRDRRLRLARGAPGRGGARGAPGAVPVRGRRRPLPAARGPRRARLVADARGSH